MYRRWEVPSNASSALSLVWVGLLERVSLLQILTKYWSQYCSMVKLYNFHLGSHQCPPLTVTTGACSRDQRCTGAGILSLLWLSRFEQFSNTSDFWPSHSGDCRHERERQPNNTIVLYLQPTCSMCWYCMAKLLSYSTVSWTPLLRIVLCHSQVSQFFSFTCSFSFDCTSGHRRQ